MVYINFVLGHKFEMLSNYIHTFSINMLIRTSCPMYVIPGAHELPEGCGCQGASSIQFCNQVLKFDQCVHPLPCLIGTECTPRKQRFRLYEAAFSPACSWEECSLLGWECSELHSGTKYIYSSILFLA